MKRAMKVIVQFKNGVWLLLSYSPNDLTNKFLHRKMKFQELGKSMLILDPEQSSRLIGGSDSDYGGGTGTYTCVFDAMSRASEILGCPNNSSYYETGYAQFYGTEQFYSVVQNGFTLEQASNWISACFSSTILDSYSAIANYLQNGGYAILAVPGADGYSHAVTCSNYQSNINMVTYFDPEDGKLHTTDLNNVQYAIGVGN